MATMDPAASLTTAEQALRDLIAVVMFQEHGANWMDAIVASELRARWKEVREQEARQRTGHALGGVSDLSYAYLGDLIVIIKKKGHWARLFEPVLGPKDAAFALLELLERVRRPIDHARPLLPFEDDLASGIAGYIRNRVTKHLSTQDLGGDYYPRIDRIEDNRGNAFTLLPGVSPDTIGTVQATTTELTVGEVVTFRCTGTDPQGRTLGWSIGPSSGGTSSEATGDTDAELTWTVGPGDTGNQSYVLIRMSQQSDSPYHRNVSGNAGADGIVIFYYRVVPPRN